MSDQGREYLSQYRGHVISVQKFVSGYGDYQWAIAIDGKTVGLDTADMKRDALRWAKQYVDGIVE